MISPALARWSLLLAATPEAWAALMAGKPVEHAQLNPKWLAHAKALRLVRLDVAAIDHLFPTHDWEQAA